MKNILSLLLPLLISSFAQAATLLPVDSFPAKFSDGQIGLIEIFDTGECCRYRLDVTVNKVRHSFRDFMISGQKAYPLRSGFAIDDNGGGSDPSPDGEDGGRGKTVHIDLLRGSLVVTEEWEFDKSAHLHHAEPQWRHHDSIDYVAGELSYYREGDGEKFADVEHARLPADCGPPKLEDYKYFTAPRCALDAMK